MQQIANSSNESFSFATATFMQESANGIEKLCATTTANTAQDTSAHTYAELLGWLLVDVSVRGER